MWEHVILESDEPGDESIEFERLSVGAWVDLEIVRTQKGCYVKATDACYGVIDIGMTDNLETAKQLAEKWAVEQIAKMLKSLGAKKVWLAR